MPLTKTERVFQTLKKLGEEGGCKDVLLASLPDLTGIDINNAVYTLMRKRCIYKTHTKVMGAQGRMQVRYAVTKTIDQMPKKTTKKKKLVREKTVTRVQLIGVQFKERKISLLQKWVKKTYGTERDLFIGLLSDLGAKQEEAA